MLSKDLLQFFPGKPRFVGPINIQYKKKIDKHIINRLTEFIKSSITSLSKIGLSKAVVGLSGGVDSSIVCALYKKALGKKAFTVIVDFDKSKDFSMDTKFSIKLAKKIGINYRVIKAGTLFNDHLKLMHSKNLLMHLHLRTRVINNIIFQVADNEFAAVADTTDKSEKLLGRHAECFYGHFAPLIDLYKTELYDLVELLSLPKEVITRQPGCSELLDIDAFGVDWRVIDPIVFLIAEKGWEVEKISREYKIDKSWLIKLKGRIDKQPLRTEVNKLYIL